MNAGTILTLALGALGALASTAHPASQCPYPKLTAPGAQAGDGLGAAAALSGGLALVGAPHAHHGGLPKGSAYVYRQLGGSQWVYEDELSNASGGEGDLFGVAVDLDGGLAVVGAPEASSAGVQSGVAHVYERMGFTQGPQTTYFWIHAAVLVPSDGDDFDDFGRTVAIDGDTVLVGAPNDDELGLSKGSVYAFRRVDLFGTAVWSQEAKLLPPPGSFAFGQSLDLSGDRCLIGAASNDPVAGTGRAYVFERAGSSWALTWELAPVNPGPFDFFGHDVALDGDHAAVAAPQDGPLGSVSVYRYTGLPVQWVLEAELVGSDTQAGDLYGWSVAMSGTRVVVGASWESSVAEKNGAAYAFERQVVPFLGISWPETAKLVAPDAEEEDRLAATGVAVDGADVLLGAAGDDDWGAGSGSAHAFNLEGDCGTSPCGWFPYGENLGAVHTLLLTGEGGTTPGSTARAVTTGATAPFVFNAAYLAEALFPFAGGFGLVDLSTQILGSVDPVIDGAATWEIPIAANPGFAGLDVYFQALATDAAQPGGVSLSNGLRLTICP